MTEEGAGKKKQGGSISDAKEYIAYDPGSINVRNNSISTFVQMFAQR
jgi:hypothetical protein